jgi:hypothetical protein
LLYFWHVRLHTTPRETVKTHLTLPKLKIISHSLRLKKLKIISGKTKNPYLEYKYDDMHSFGLLIVRIEVEY